MIIKVLGVNVARPRKTNLKYILICILLIFVSGKAFSDITLSGINSAEDWINPDSSLIFIISEDINVKGEIRIFVGRLEVTQLFIRLTPRKYSKPKNTFPLQSGDQELVVHHVDLNNEWSEVGRASLKVLTSTGLEMLEVTPRLNIENKSLLTEGHSGDAFPPERDEFYDLNLEGGIDVSGERGETRFGVNVNVVGASHREDALRFGEKGVKASKVDLTDYLVTFSHDDLKAELGHISYGNNPLLLSEFSSRGVKGGYQLSQRWDFSASVQSGSDIVGYDRLTGLDNDENQIMGATIGLEMFPDNPSQFRVELSYMDASLQGEPDFDTGEIPDAEKSNGYGLRLTGNVFSGRLRSDLIVARSKYTAPPDPFLDFGFDDLVEVEATTNEARFAEVSYDIVQDLVLGQSVPLTVSTQLTYEMVDPEYKTIGAFPNSDRLNKSVNLSIYVGPVSMQIDVAKNEDNIDDIPTILKTRTRTQTLALELPLPELLGTPTTVQLWPSLSYVKEFNHQEAINDPDAALSGFNGGSHLPDQVTHSDNLAFNWFFDKWNFVYNVSKSIQDNRQVGREKADFTTIGNEFNLSLTPLEKLHVELSFSRNLNKDRETQLNSFQKTKNLALNWRFLKHWSVALNHSDSSDTDSENNAENNSATDDIQVTYQFEIPRGVEKLPGQAFIRYAKTDSENKDNIFGFNSNAGTWGVNAGLSLTLF